MKITSVNNDLIKETAKLLKGSKYRNESGLFLIEGEKGIDEAIKSGIEIKKVFLSNNEPFRNEILKQVQNDIEKVKPKPLYQRLEIENY